ncbi:hypothetical protein PflCFBP13514_22655 [Pseudomonas fluorescens]|nr:hypothetical protein PflCFBP13514_22655 [Pseudomonas fluorescens]
MQITRYIRHIQLRPSQASQLSHLTEIESKKRVSSSEVPRVAARAFFLLLTGPAFRLFESEPPYGQPSKSAGSGLQSHPRSLPPCAPTAPTGCCPW